jgi:hypothetical protein
MAAKFDPKDERRISASALKVYVGWDEMKYLNIE